MLRLLSSWRRRPKGLGSFLALQVAPGSVPACSVTSRAVRSLFPLVLSRNLPRASEASTKSWYRFDQRPGVSNDAGSKFQGGKKSLRGTWPPCKRELRALSGRASVGLGCTPSGVPEPIGGSQVGSSLVLEAVQSAQSYPLAAVNSKLTCVSKPRVVARRLSPFLTVGLLRRGADLTSPAGSGWRRRTERSYL